jgi:hypothetical protein
MKLTLIILLFVLLILLCNSASSINDFKLRHLLKTEKSARPNSNIQDSKKNSKTLSRHNRNIQLSNHLPSKLSDHYHQKAVKHKRNIDLKPHKKPSII